MREKFNEKRAKWLARSKRSGGSPADESPRSSSHSHSQRTDASDAESLSGSSLNVHTAESETQTDGGISASNSRPLVGGGSCVLRTPSPARRRRIHLELQLQRREERAEHQKVVPQDSPTPTHQQQANA